MPLQPAPDASAGQWIADRVTTFAKDVGSLLPSVFAGYVRVFHAAGLGEGEGRAVRWGDIAQANGHVLQPATVFSSIVPRECFDEDRYHWRQGQAGLWDRPPEEGELPEDLARHLSRVLAGHTSTADHCYFAYWNGWGDPAALFAPARDPNEEADQEKIRASYESGEVYAGTPRQWKDSVPTFSLPGREYYLFEGSIEEVTTDWNGVSGQLPTMWWPRDRAWFVHTEIDFDTTYVGGSRSCIKALMNDADLEVVEVQADSPLPQL